MPVPIRRVAASSTLAAGGVLIAAAAVALAARGHRAAPGPALVALFVGFGVARTFIEALAAAR